MERHLDNAMSVQKRERDDFRQYVEVCTARHEGSNHATLVEAKPARHVEHVDAERATEQGVQYATQYAPARRHVGTASAYVSRRNDDFGAVALRKKVENERRPV